MEVRPTTSAAAESRRQVVFSDLGPNVRAAIRKLMPILIALSAIGAGHLFIAGNPGAVSFALIVGSSLAALALWASSGRGLPVLALFATQNLALYGIPIIAGNEGVAAYPEHQLFKAAWEVCLFNAALMAGWSIGTRVLRPGSALCYALLGLDTVSKRLATLGIALISVSTAYVVGSAAGALHFIFEILPSGSAPILFAAVSAMSASGFFLSGMMVGRGQATRSQSITFWAMLGIQCFVAAGGFLLSASILVVSASVVGVFWGSGRVPWRLLTVFLIIFAFLNLGKFVMRERYWKQGDEASTTTTLVDMPRTYVEWITVSFGIIMGDYTEEVTRDSFAEFGGTEAQLVEGQSLLHRVNNLSNLLYVVDVMETRKIPPLGGATYSLIPPLLVPRILWPSKPRTHEGQILLNVHFGRQDLNSTYRTYIAWGLLPEGYGNFGPLKGSLIVGLFIGLFAAWIELATLRKMVLSLEGFLAFTTFLLLTNSFEMVASVLVTALFQAVMPIIVATSPFVARIHPKRLTPTSG